MDDAESIRQSVSALEKNHMLLKSTVDQLADSVKLLTSAVSTLSEKWQQSKQTNWPVLIGISIPVIGIIAAGLSGWQKIIDLQTDAKISPVLAQNAISSTDRSRLNSEVSTLTADLSGAKSTVSANQAHLQDQGDRLDRLNSTLNETRSALASFQAESKAKGVEIETQFRASDYKRNSEWAETYRILGLLWQKAYPGTVFPEFSALSTVAQPNNGKQ